MADFIDKGSIFPFQKLILTLYIASALLGIRAFAEPVSEKEALLRFISNVTHNKARVNWDPSISACKWTGVVCDRNESHICFLRLPGVGLLGQIPPNTISQLTRLRVLSLRNNKLYGSVPSDFGNLTYLTHLFLQHNHISGLFPDSFMTLPNLARLDISYNQFEGRIPESINNLLLQTLFLQNNKFSGEIPFISDTSNLIAFDISNNNLTGEIPKTLSKFPESSFIGNALLCGNPLPSCNKLSPSPSLPPSPKPSNRLPSYVITIINVICVVAALFLFIILAFCIAKRCRRRGAEQSPLPLSTTELSDTSPKHTEVQCELTKHNRLVFFEPGKYGFDLQALLGASAEVLGKGSTGTSYKAEMDDGTTVAVKRLKEVVLGKKEFDNHMAMLGQIRHENVVNLIAYYYCKDEKLLISQFMPAGSLSNLLHGTFVS